MFHFAATTFKIFFTSLRSHGFSLPSTTAFIDAVVRGKESLARSHMLHSALLKLCLDLPKFITLMINCNNNNNNKTS